MIKNNELRNYCYIRGTSLDSGRCADNKEFNRN